MPPLNLFQAQTPYETYLGGLNTQELANLKDLQTKLGKYCGLRVGDIEQPNNNAGELGIRMTERIDFTKSEQYTLSIRLSADGFSFSIYNPLTDNDFCFVPHPVNTGYSMTANLKDMLTKTEALKYPYKRVNILYDSPRFTPVPLELFEDEQMDTIFYHNFLKLKEITRLYFAMSWEEAMW